MTEPVVPPEHPVNTGEIRTEIAERNGEIVVWLGDIPLVEIAVHAIWTGSPDHPDEAYNFTGDNGCRSGHFRLASWDYAHGGFDNGNYAVIWTQPLPETRPPADDKPTYEQLLDLVRTIVDFHVDGDTVDGDDEFGMENDDAVDSVISITHEARALLGLPTEREF